ncbi:HepT-like ribonuclease domain-containing protein [Lentzea sp. NPDC042327]|uniref:HepT-like ribonuclease domain-containing protein n=1 Tax=Lentzea sp. NPDC042327 TaxID=3154801 RepID=UPI0033EDA3BD
MNNLSKVDPKLAALVPDLARIVAFRNILIHGYATVDDALVWQVLTEKRPRLEEHLRQLSAGLS